MTLSAATHLSTQRICFYGAGSMAEAIVRGLVTGQLLSPDNISMLNRSNRDKLAELHDRYGVKTILQGESNEHYLRQADIIILAMKPKDAAEAIASLRPLLSGAQLLISVVAGLSIAAIGKLAGQNAAIVRAMPNTSSTIGLGATGISYADSVSQQQRAAAETLFRSVGINAIVDEALQPAVTGVSGSGPAYVYYMMEAMIEAAVQSGIDAEAARELVVQTFVGAAQMVRQTGEAPEALRRKVTSPNGTTEAALKTMQQGGLSELIVKGVLRSAERATELGQAIEQTIEGSAQA